jgi:protein SCO1/2
MKKPLLVGALVLPLVMWSSYFAFRQPRQPAQAEQGLRSGTFEPPREAPGFILDGSNGKKVSLRDYLGKVVIVEFGYTNCQTVCPVWLSNLSDIFSRLGSASHDIQLIYVTVDPKRDSPERLREHLAMFNTSFLGATGSPADLEDVRNAYGAFAEQVKSPNPGPGYVVDHSTSIYLVDRQGMLRGLVPFGTPVENIRHDLKFLLKAGS